MNYFLFKKGEVPCEITMFFDKPIDEKKSDVITFNSLFINIKYFNETVTLELKREDLLNLKSMYEDDIIDAQFSIMSLIDVCRKKMEKNKTMPSKTTLKKYVNDIYIKIEEAAKELKKIIDNYN